MTNKSGITPSGNRIVIQPDEVEQVTDGGIIIPATEAEKRQGAQSIGTLIAVGPDAWTHTTEFVYRIEAGQKKLFEVRTKGYSEDFAKVGERVAFAKFGGLPVIGADGEQYRIMNDEDLTCRVSDEVSFTDLNSRKRVGSK